MSGQAFLLWTPESTWLQTYDDEGCVKLADLGKRARLSVELFALDHGIEFVQVRPGVGAPVADLVVGVAARLGRVKSGLSGLRTRSK